MYENIDFVGKKSIYHWIQPLGTLDLFFFLPQTIRSDLSLILLPSDPLARIQVGATFAQTKGKRMEFVP